MKHETLVQGLKKLRLNTIATEYSEVARQCENSSQTFEQYLARLVEIETETKHHSKIERLIKQAGFPKGKDLRSFDFERQSGITAQQIERLSQGQFLADGTNIVFYGSFGVGKSHLAEGLTRALCEREYRCLFTTAHKLINELERAHQSLTLASLFKKLDRYDLLTIDELGYSPHSKDGADLFFQLISERYERRSIIFTTNLTYSEWDRVFLNQTTTAAAVDRIIHKCETFNITANSWRAEEAQKRMEASKKTSK